MTDTDSAILDAVASVRADTEALLIRLVREPSLLGQEHGAIAVMHDAFAELGLAPRRVPIEEAALAGKPGWSPPLIPYVGRDCVVASHRPRTPRGRALL